MEAIRIAPARTRVAMVVPPRAIVDAPVADLRAEPRSDAELVDQLHYREMPRVLGTRGAWHYVQAEDHYFGWIHDPSVQLMPGLGDPGRLIGVIAAPLYEKPDRDARVVATLPAGTVVANVQRPEPPAGWLRLMSRMLELTGGVSEAYISLEDVVEAKDLAHRPPTAHDLIATAEAFLGVPYLWGGTTALGMDCSGYVQQVYRLNGIRLDRDADQQAMEGRPVEEARAGDLLFFGDARVTHVGMSIGDGVLFHAPQRGAFVERGTQGTRKLRAIRRYLPDPG